MIVLSQDGFDLVNVQNSHVWIDEEFDVCARGEGYDEDECVWLYRAETLDEAKGVLRELIRLMQFTTNKAIDMSDIEEVGGEMRLVRPKTEKFYS